MSFTLYYHPLQDTAVAHVMPPAAVMRGLSGSHAVVLVVLRPV